MNRKPSLVRSEFHLICMLMCQYTSRFFFKKPYQYIWHLMKPYKILIYSEKYRKFKIALLHVHFNGSIVHCRNFQFNILTCFLVAPIPGVSWIDYLHTCKQDQPYKMWFIETAHECKTTCAEEERCKVVKLQLRGTKMFFQFVS